MSTLNSDKDNPVVEQALRDGELHKALLDHLDAGIYMVDRNRRILYWNRGAEQISGYLAQDVAGHFCQGDLLMHCDAAGRGICGKGCPLSSVMFDGMSREHVFFLRHRHGHRIPVQVRARAIYDSAGAIIGAVETGAHSMSTDVSIRWRRSQTAPTASSSLARPWISCALSEFLLDGWPWN
jgi:PAS domain-containing protein